MDNMVLFLVRSFLLFWFKLVYKPTCEFYVEFAILLNKFCKFFQCTVSFELHILIITELWTLVSDRGVLMAGNKKTKST